MILLIWVSSKVRNFLRKCLRSTASPLCCQFPLIFHQSNLKETGTIVKSFSTTKLSVIRSEITCSLGNRLDNETCLECPKWALAQGSKCGKILVSARTGSENTEVVKDPTGLKNAISKLKIKTKNPNEPFCGMETF